MRVVRVAGTEQRGRLNVRNKRNSEVNEGQFVFAGTEQKRRLNVRNKRSSE